MHKRIKTKKVKTSEECDKKEFKDDDDNNNNNIIIMIIMTVIEKEKH